MPLLTLADAELSYGDLPLLDRAFFALEERERIGLIGRNGTGKSSLLAAIAGRIALDGGELKTRDALRVVLVEQEPALAPAPTIRQALLAQVAVPAHKLEEFLDRLNVNADSAPASASGGGTKRAAPRLAFAPEPHSG